MKKFLVFVAVVVVVVVAVGVYRDWFNFSSARHGDQTDATVTVDHDKIRKDSDIAKEKVQDLGQKVKDKAGEKPPKE